MNASGRTVAPPSPPNWGVFCPSLPGGDTGACCTIHTPRYIISRFHGDISALTHSTQWLSARNSTLHIFNNKGMLRASGHTWRSRCNYVGDNVRSWAGAVGGEKWDWWGEGVFWLNHTDSAPFVLVKTGLQTAPTSPSSHLLDLCCWGQARKAGVYHTERELSLFFYYHTPACWQNPIHIQKKQDWCCLSQTRSLVTDTLNVNGSVTVRRSPSSFASPIVILLPNMYPPDFHLSSSPLSTNTIVEMTWKKHWFQPVFAKWVL